MKEYNFFEAVMEEKKGKNYFGIIITVVIIIAIAYLSIEAGVNVVEYFRLNNDIEALRVQAVINADMVEQLNLTREEARLLEERFDYLYRADLLARSSRVVTLELMETLPTLTPAYLTLRTVSVAGNVLQVTGISPDMETLAQFEHSLRNSDFFNNPIINSARLDRQRGVITQEDGAMLAGPYRFDATAAISLDGVMLLDFLFDTNDEFILRANDPDHIWDNVMATKQLSERGIVLRERAELMEALEALNEDEEEYREDDEDDE